MDTNDAGMPAGQGHILNSPAGQEAYLVLRLKRAIKARGFHPKEGPEDAVLGVPRKRRVGEWRIGGRGAGRLEIVREGRTRPRR